MAILLLGLFTALVCLLLLFVPFFSPSPAPGDIVRYGLIDLLSGQGLLTLRMWLYNRFIPVVAALFVLVLAVLPWWAARSRRAGGPRTQGASGSEELSTRAGDDRISRAEHRSSLVFADDGRIEDEGHPGSWRIFRSVPELREMARAAGIPWHTDFETEGGARGFLEILRAVAVEPPVTGVTETAPTEAAPTETAAPATAPPATAPSVLPDDTPADDSSEDYRLSSPSWAPSYSGSVYTSTTLYSSERMDGPEGDPDPLTDDEERSR